MLIKIHRYSFPSLYAVFDNRNGSVRFAHNRKLNSQSPLIRAATRAFIKIAVYPKIPHRNRSIARKVLCRKALEWSTPLRMHTHTHTHIRADTRLYHIHTYNLELLIKRAHTFLIGALLLVLSRNRVISWPRMYTSKATDVFVTRVLNCNSIRVQKKSRLYDSGFVPLSPCPWNYCTASKPDIGCHRKQYPTHSRTLSNSVM